MHEHVAPAAGISGRSSSGHAEWVAKNEDTGSVVRTRRRRLRFVLAVLAVGVSLAGAAWIYHHTHGYWRRLQRAEQTFRVPPDFQRIGTVREGTTFCVISCDEARITLVLGTTLPPHEACGRLREAVERQIGQTETPAYLAWCGWEARLRDVGSEAYVTGGAEGVVDLAQNRPSWAFKFPPPTRGNVAWVQFTSGID